MEHTYYFDSDSKKIAWTIENDENRFDQVRVHIEEYYDKLSVIQSKYVALHVGIFWSIGRFIIKNNDVVNVMVDLESMFDLLSKNQIPDDPFIISRTRSIRQLLDQRKLTVNYLPIDNKSNKASYLLA